VVWILSRPEPTPLLVAAAIDYDAPAPPNAWAKEDIERILSLREAKIVTSPGKNVDWSTSVWKNAASGKIALKAQLDEAVGQGAKLVIVYLSMHGVVNGENEPCLLPPAASPLDSSKWLKVRDLLDSLFPKQGERPKRTLLILDCNRIDVNWDMGVLHNSFAERLKPVVKEKQAEYPGLAVLNSTSPGQVGWPTTGHGSSKRSPASRCVRSFAMWWQKRPRRQGNGRPNRLPRPVNPTSPAVRPKPPRSISSL
jgi:hypothetical protein